MKNKKGLLLSIVLFFLNKESKLEIAKKEFELQKSLYLYEGEEANLDRRLSEKRNIVLFRTEEALTHTENELIKKKAELNSTIDKINTEKDIVDSKIAIVKAETESYKIICESRLNEIRRLTTIVDALTKQLNSKVEIIK